MANTTISIRSSGDTGVTPSLGVLANGELALNFADGILYYKTASNTLGSITTTEPAGLNKEIQFNDSGSFGSNAGLTFDKTTGAFIVPSLNVASVYTLPTTDGTADQVLTTDGSGTITFADVPTPPANVSVSTFSGTGDGTTTTYSLGYYPLSKEALLATIGGVLQDPSTAYTIDQANNTITFTSPPANTAPISVVSLYTNVTPIGPADVIVANFYTTANGVVDTYDLDFNVTSANNITVAVDGILQTPTLHYTVNTTANTITFGSIPPASSNISVVSLYTNANTYTNTIASSAYDHANAAFDAANTAQASHIDTYARGHANGAFDAANTNATTDFTNVSITAGDYGSAVIIPVVHLEANGRVSSVTNTSITSGTTSDVGIVQLTDATNSTSTTTAATPNSVKSAYDLADTANTNAATAQSTADGAQTHAEGAFTQANTNATTDYTNVSITAGDYGSATIIPVVHLEANGRVSSVTNTTITSSSTSAAGIVQLYDGVDSTSTTTAATANSAKVAYDHGEAAFTQANTNASSITTTNSRLDSAFGHANSAFDTANTKFDSAGGTISGDTTITGNLTVTGTRTFANTVDTLIADNIVTLNAAIDQASAPALNAGIEIDRGSSANVLLLWNETDDVWTFTNDGSTYYSVPTNTSVSTAQTHADGAFDHANGAFTAANSAATSDYTNVSITAGDYGSAVIIPVVHLEANGRVSAVTNTSITSASTSDAGIVQLTDATNSTSTTTAATPNAVKSAYDLADTANTNAAAAQSTADGAQTHAEGAFTQANTNSTTDFTNVSIVAGDYGSATIIPVVHLEANGRVSAVTNTTITSSSTSTAGIVQLTDATNSTSTTTAATPNAVKSAYDLADTANTNAATAQAHAEGAFTQANTNSTTDYTNVSITAGDYGSEVIIPVVHLEANGRVSAVANTSVRAGSTSVTGIVQLTDATNSTSTTTAATPNAVKSAYDLASTANTNAATAQSTADGAQTHAEGAFGHANGAFDAANTKFASAGGTISGDTTITGNLTVVGETVYANTTTALIADNILTVNAAIDQASAPASNAGLEVDRGSSANVSLLWNETDDKWTFTNDGSAYSPIADADRLDSAFSAANTAQSTADGAQTHAEAAFTQANTNSTSDYTNVSITAGDYGSAVIIPVLHLEANGRVSSVTNTSITSGSTSDAGIVQLTDATNSTSTTTAATPNSVKSAYDLADTANTNAATAQSTADGAQTHAEAAFTQANTNSTSDYTNVSVTNGTYGNASYIPSVTVEANGRVSAISTTAFSAATVGDILALSIALG